jgi:L-malate glycosyltransferase
MTGSDGNTVEMKRAAESSAVVPVGLEPPESETMLSTPARDRTDGRHRRPRLKILVLYAQPTFWSMGEGRGTEIFTRLPEAMAARGHRVMVSLPGAAGEAVAAEIEHYHGFELHRKAAARSFVQNAQLRLPARLRDRLSCWRSYQRWALAAARRSCAETNPDLVLGMGIFEAPAAHRLAVELGVPCAVRLFGNNLSMNLHTPLKLYANFPEVIAFRTPADVLVLTDDGADGEAVARRLKVRARKFVHMRNGVDFDLFHPGPPSPEIRRAVGLREDQPLLITVTRLAAEKKLERAIDALCGLRSRRPDAVLALLGTGSEEARLKALARERGVTEAMLFPGAFLREDLPDWYRTADVVLSLLDRTNASNPVFEAMACGRPVVALDAGATGRVVQHGETGLLLPHQDLPRLGDILADLLADSELLGRMGRRGACVIHDLVMNKRERLDYEVDLLEDLVLARPGAHQGASR